ncbi:MAG: hypothetical protein ACXADY_25090 [Candidatus Hodarchaeales archaeon]|jgi:hypothetical protein
MDIAQNLCDLVTTVDAIPDVPADTEDITLGAILGPQIAADACFNDVAYASGTQLNVLLNEMADLICTNVQCCADLKELLAQLWQEVYNGDEGDAPDDDGDVVIDNGGTATSTPTGLTVDLSNPTNPDENIYMVEGTLLSVDDTSAIPLDATMDNYIDVTTAGTYVKSSVPIGNPAPPTLGLRLYKYETDGSSVVSTTDLRNYYFFNGTQFADNSIGTRHILDLNVTRAKIADTIAPGSIGHSDFLEVTYDAKGLISSVAGSIAITAITDGDILRYNATGGRWENIALGTVALPVASARQMTYYDGANWQVSNTINNDGTYLGFGFVSTTELSADYIMNHSTELQFAIKPVAPNLAASAGGSLSPSTTYYYSIEWLDGAGGNMVPTEYSQATTVGDLTITIDLYWPKGAVTARIWRSTTSGTYTQYHDYTADETFVDDGTPVYSAGTFPTTWGNQAIEISTDGIFMGVDRDTTSLMHMLNRNSVALDGWKLEMRPWNATANVNGIQVWVDNVAATADLTVAYYASASGSTDDNIAFWAEVGRIVVGGNLSNQRTYAALQLEETDKGLLFNRLTTTERDAMTLVADDAGLTIYNTSQNTVQTWNGTSWVNLGSSGSTVLPYRPISGNYTVVVADYLLKQDTAGSIVTLHTAVGNSGLVHNLKNDSAGNITLDCTGLETIDGAPNITVVPGAAYTVYSDGANWVIM